MRQMDQKPGSPQELALRHFGVKGMRWGVRKQKQLDRARSVAEGRAGFARKASYTLGTSVPKLLINKGNIRKIAKEEQTALEAQKRRIELGKATTADKIDRYMNTSIFDLARGK